MATTQTDRLYKIAKDKAVVRLGGWRASRVVGNEIFRAFIAQEILTVIATQDESTDPQTIRTLFTTLHETLTDEFQIA